MAKMHFTPADDYIDEVWGKKGTPERDNMEVRLKEEVDNYFIGEAIRKERLSQHLTQEQLGERIGVKKSQVSKLESGKGVITLPTMRRAFRALGFNSASLDLGKGTRVALW